MLHPVLQDVAPAGTAGSTLERTAWMSDAQVWDSG